MQSVHLGVQLSDFVRGDLSNVDVGSFGVGWCPQGFSMLVAAKQTAVLTGAVVHNFRPCDG